MSTYLAIGSICWDQVPTSDGVERRLGGSVLFAARVARAAGWDVVVATSGTDELAAAARRELSGVEVLVQASPTDTVMAFDERTELGPQRVPTVADPIDLRRLGVDASSADIVHLAPIMGEVTRDLVDQVRGSRLVGITPQGLLRGRGPDGRLRLVEGDSSWWAGAVDAIVVSDQEYQRIDGPLGEVAAAVAVTRGWHGCWGWHGTEGVDLDGIPVEPSPAGTIGAGDVFASTLFLTLAEGAGFTEAMERANRTAAAHVGGDVAG